MSHIVIHDDIDGATQYRQFDDLGAAVAYLEEQQNAAPAASAKLFALQEVRFEVKPYYKIEVVGDIVAGPEAVEADVIAPAVAEWVAARAESSMVAAETTGQPEMSYVETVVSEPIETFAREALAPVEPGSDDHVPTDVADPAAGTEVRRGLFGR